MSAALAYVHDQGIVARDVKPANILIDEHGRAEATDFGIAHLVDATRHTAPATVIGTAAYIAPEQANGSTDVGPAADVYSLGLVLLECLTGTQVYSGTASEAAVSPDSRVIPRSLRASARAWQSLLGSMTERVSHARPERPRAVGAELAADRTHGGDGSDGRTDRGVGGRDRAHDGGDAEGDRVADADDAPGDGTGRAIAYGAWLSRLPGPRPTLPRSP